MTITEKYIGQGYSALSGGAGKTKKYGFQGSYAGVHGKEIKMVDVKYFDQAVSFMDNEIREEIHRSGEYDENPEGFLREYERQHLEKYGEEFSI